MRRFAAIILLALGVSACGTDRGFVYTGTNPDAPEGSWIKDPEAEGTTRDITGSRDQSRTRSNRVDIPVREFVTLSATSGTASASRWSRFGSGYVRTSVAAGWGNHSLDATGAVSRYGSVTGGDGLFAGMSDNRAPAMWASEELNARLGRNNSRAYTSSGQPWAETGSVPSAANYTRTWANVVKSTSQLDAAKSRTGYGEMFGSRIIGLHLWKYADRELVTDAVEVTYTIVYYNMNEQDLGPTEIVEPLPFYTEYIEGSATLPTEGATVEVVRRSGDRSYLRWYFPRGIRSGETNDMRYKVRVTLDSQYAPKDSPTGTPGRQ